MNGMEWNGMEWNGMEWNGMEWNGMEWNGMEWNGMKKRNPNCHTQDQNHNNKPIMNHQCSLRILGL
jgi:hypothetical protein